MLSILITPRYVKEPWCFTIPQCQRTEAQLLHHHPGAKNALQDGHHGDRAEQSIWNTSFSLRRWWWYNVSFFLFLCSWEETVDTYETTKQRASGNLPRRLSQITFPKMTAKMADSDSQVPLARCLQTRLFPSTSDGFPKSKKSSCDGHNWSFVQEQLGHGHGGHESNLMKILVKIVEKSGIVRQDLVVTFTFLTSLRFDFEQQQFSITSSPILTTAIPISPRNLQLENGTPWCKWTFVPTFLNGEGASFF